MQKTVIWEQDRPITLLLFNLYYIVGLIFLSTCIYVTKGNFKAKEQEYDEKNLD